MEKVVRFLQYMWLIIAVVSFCMATYHLLFTAVIDALFFYFFAAMATLLYYIRRRQLKKMGNISK